MAQWDQDWIETAEQLVRDEFDLNYANLDIPDGGMEIDNTEYSVAKVCIESNLFFFPLIPSHRTNLATYLMSFPPSLHQRNYNSVMK